MDTTPHPDEVARAASVDRLQDCLRCELSAVATYEFALARAPLVGLDRSLHEIFMSHTRRTAQLGERLRHLGAEPIESAEAWSAFVGALRGNSTGDRGRVAIAALQEGERQGVTLYTASVATCDLWTRTLLTADFLPEQQRTHDLSRALSRYVEAL